MRTAINRLELEGKYLLVVSLDDVKLLKPENGQVFAIPHWEYKQPASLTWSLEELAKLVLVHLFL